ncbi:hypothetical protein K1719_006287 [Acacia pycnantha]|nr:hypothetical protein K1719_006287 [Acacia pycnantha]
MPSQFPGFQLPSFSSLSLRRKGFRTSEMACSPAPLSKLHEEVRTPSVSPLLLVVLAGDEENPEQRRQIGVPFIITLVAVEGEEDERESLLLERPDLICRQTGHSHSDVSWKHSPSSMKEENHYLSTLQSRGNFSECRSAALMLLQKMETFLPQKISSIHQRKAYVLMLRLWTCLLTACISEAQSCVDLCIDRRDILNDKSRIPDDFAILKALPLKLEKRIADVPIESKELGYTKPGPYI